MSMSSFFLHFFRFFSKNCPKTCYKGRIEQKKIFGRINLDLKLELGYKSI
jgi:hypothetical protein